MSRRPQQSHGGGGAAPGLSATRSGPGQRHAAPCRGPIAGEMAEARRLHRRQRDRCVVWISPSNTAANYTAQTRDIAPLTPAERQVRHRARLRQVPPHNPTSPARASRRGPRRWAAAVAALVKLQDERRASRPCPLHPPGPPSRPVRYLAQHVVSYTIIRTIAPQNTVSSGESGF
jgi:hypothetical protein